MTKSVMLAYILGLTFLSTIQSFLKVSFMICVILQKLNIEHFNYIWHLLHNWE